jgi:cyclophilin family peptidyl-prolyl cis-trans isomerase/HEAT repeat protein
MTRFFQSIIIIYSFFAALPLFGQGYVHFSPEEKKIIELQDKRTGVDEIATYLSSSNEKVAWRAAIALGNIADTTARPFLRKALEKENRKYVIDGIAYALGLLGVDGQSYSALSAKANSNSDEVYIAMGRTVPKTDAPAFIKTLVKENSPALERRISFALIELGMRKLLNEDAVGLVKTLENSSDATTRWQAIYSFVRTGDSALAASHLDIIKTYLNDLGSPECRMFAAAALGAIHNAESASILVNTARSETEWRVRVNIFNALAREKYFSSGMFDVIKKAVLESNKDTLTTIHVAIAAFEALDKLIDAGTLSSGDSTLVASWLAGFDTYNSVHDDLPLPVRAFAMVPAARFGSKSIEGANISGYATYHDKTCDIYTNMAIGNYPDTNAMFALLLKVVRGDPEMVSILDGLHRQWMRATKDTAYWNLLARYHFIEPYRHMMIRMGNQEDRMDMLGPALEYVTEPNVAVDSFRTEAETYLLQYLDKFSRPEYADRQVAVLGTIASLKFKKPAFVTKVKSIYEQAAKSHNKYLADQAWATLDSLGATSGMTKLTVEIQRDSIEWSMLENCPDTLLVPTKYGFLYIRPSAYDAPLSVINILKLAKMGFYSGSSIHRLVPNFVIQTGDVTGSGYGGPGYTIRTETTPLRYDTEGICGMASDGKDTEGSQWFITHCPTPHLNTRYTIWGKVVKNIDNLDKLQFVDVVQNVIPYK